MQMVTRSQEPLDNFAKISKMDQVQQRYKVPTIFRITKWDAFEYGWPVTCLTGGKTTCINTIRQNGKRLIIKACAHPDKQNARLKADDAYVVFFQKNDYGVGKNFK
jgi:hypothetical protein